MSEIIWGVKIYQSPHKKLEVRSIIRSVCAAVWLTIFSFFAPKYWAIKIDPAILSQLPSEIVKKIIIPATVTVATQSCHNLPTQYASANWYATCSILVITIGIERMSNAFPIGISKSGNFVFCFIKKW